MSTTLDLLKAADDLLLACEGLPPEEMDATIAAWMDGAADKATALQAVVAKAESQGEFLSQEAAALTAAAKQQIAVADRCRGLIVSLLRKQASLGEKPIIRGPGWSAFLRETKAVEVSDPGVLPPVYMRTRVSTEPDKAAIKADIEAGNLIPGASLVTRYSATIRKAGA